MSYSYRFQHRQPGTYEHFEQRPLAAASCLNGNENFLVIANAFRYCTRLVCDRFDCMFTRSRTLIRPAIKFICGAIVITLTNMWKRDTEVEKNTQSSEAVISKARARELMRTFQSLHWRVAIRTYNHFSAAHAVCVAQHFTTSIISLTEIVLKWHIISIYVERFWVILTFIWTYRNI